MVWPEAMRAASRSGLRTLSAKLRETVVAASEGPSRVAFRMAADRVGGGEAGGRDAFAGSAGELEGAGAHAANASTTTNARALTGR